MDNRIKSLFKKYVDDTCSREEFDEVFEYMSANPEDKELEKMMELQYRRHVRPPGGRSLVIPAIAAIFILMASVFTWLALDRSGDRRVTGNLRETSFVSTTNNSELKYLMLPDSTQVWLNAASSIEIIGEFGKGKREVRLTGEAYFDVRHRQRMPFIIHTGKVSTEVLGTAFNIKAYPDLERITVSVKRGKVKVNYSEREVATLVKGQQVSIGTRTSEIKRKPVKEEETAAWQEGNLIYDDYSVADIVKDLEKVYNTKILVDDTSVRQMNISTMFKREGGVQLALEILCRLTDAQLFIENGTYIIKNQ